MSGEPSPIRHLREARDERPATPHEVFVHNSIQFTFLDIGNHCIDQDFEACAIHLNSVHDKLCILAIYRSSWGNFNTFLTNLDLILPRFFNLNFNFIICGDINFDHHRGSYKKLNSTKFYRPLILPASSIFLLE